MTWKRLLPPGRPWPKAEPVSCEIHGSTLLVGMKSTQRGSRRGSSGKRVLWRADRTREADVVDVNVMRAWVRIESR